MAKREDETGIGHLKTEELKMISLNIFPQCNTITHLLSSKTGYLTTLYEASKVVDLDSDNRVGKIAIPFVKNFDGISPMHICIQAKNIQALNVILELIAEDPLCNHINAFVDILPKIIELELPSIAYYLTSRQL